MMRHLQVPALSCPASWGFQHTEFPETDVGGQIQDEQDEIDRARMAVHW